MRSPRKIILGVSGGIAAYKSAELLRRLQDRGFDITVVPTQASLNFVGIATWEGLSGNPVQSDLWQNISQVPHVNLAKNSDAILIAPATADLIARLAIGRADDLLTTTVLSSDAPKIIIPAMHPNMWLNPATQSNVKLLTERGFHILEPSVGPLTSGDTGIGRFPESFEIIDFFLQSIGSKSDLLGKKVLITAGGTREDIDPVRYIGNRSSGKQGYALANACAGRGAKVVVIAANVSLADPAGVEVIKVNTALEMGEKLFELAPAQDLIMMSAAVSDYRVADRSQSKIKRDGSALKLELIENPDLIATISVAERPNRQNQIIMAFAAETSISIEQAQEKLLRKGVDLLFLNDVANQDVFGSERNGGYLLDSAGVVAEIPYQSKDTLAEDLLDLVVKRLD
jgi:phosphopantothenoylcysteine decarboxylase/phosphopantothenate--cysteine ligase